MNEFEFTLIYKLNNNEEDPSKYLDALFEVGCDDAIVSLGKKGMISLDFIRDGIEANLAIISALKDVKKAIPDATLVEASPDFVTTTELSRILDHSRQNARMLMIKKDSPPPAHMGSPNFWHLSEVFEWLIKDDKIINYHVDNTMIEIANVTKKVNLSIAMAGIDEPISEFVI
ncbi:MAG: DNA-binding protein [Helicobacteraceae bacterium]|nr:DNA-binding protein [Helicobacteraceae bacterium]